MTFTLFDALDTLFRGKVYRHRASNQGDALARCFYEDLYGLNRSALFNGRVDRQEGAVNVSNVVPGRSTRRGDGTFGETLATVAPVLDVGFHVATGKTANVQIGVEVKILATAMIKQIDRVMGDLEKQARTFRASNDRAITVGIVGVNHAAEYESYEGDRSFRKTGTQAPSAEAARAIARITNEVAPHFDELLILPFEAPNAAPFPFALRDAVATRNAYAAALQRTLRAYEQRFP